VDTASDPPDESGPAIGTTGARFGGAPRRRRTARRKAEADVPAVPEQAAEADTAAIPVVPPSPFPRGGARRHGAPAEEAAPVHPAPAAEVSDGAEVGLTGARFGGAGRQRKSVPPPESAPPETAPPESAPPETAPPESAPPEPAAAASPAQPSPSEAPPPPDTEEPVAGGSAFVRPYVLTRGRTRAAFELSIETLVSAAPEATRAGLIGEHHTVLGLCQEPRSVAEIAALVGVPLGVARVLVGDLAAAGIVAVHGGTGEAGPDLALMQRVLSGLRRL
jgi:hypothetical protein